MQAIIAQRTINAPIDRVFRTIADPDVWSQVHDHITKIEFLTERHSGLGTRFRETRLMRGKEATTELEVTAYQENDHIRLVTPPVNGTVWDTIFSVRSHDGHTHLTMTMDGRSDKLMAKMFNAMIRSMIAKQIQKDMDAVKAFCER